MRIAALSDIHGNLPALSTALRIVRAEHVDQMVFLGDYAGYGGFAPGMVLDQVMEMAAEEGAICLRGNHDQAMIERRRGGPSPQYESMIDAAQLGIEVDCQRVSEVQLEWLESLPLTATVESVLFSHGAVPYPERFRYPTSDRVEAATWPEVYAYADEVAAELRRRKTPILVHGHTHTPRLLIPNLGAPHHTKRLLPTRPAYELPHDGASLVDVGSVGFIRSKGKPSFCILDTGDGSTGLRFIRFDVDSQPL